jgi:2-phosphoglycerate kinase
MRNACSSTSVLMILGLLLIPGLVCPPQSQASEEKYTWCKADDLDVHGKRVFYSDPFPEEASRSMAEYAQAFENYVRSHYGVTTATASCEPSITNRSQSEAKAARDQDASNKRSVRIDVVFSGWTY